MVFRTALEGQNVQSIGKGTSGAKALTLSFWVKSNKTGTYTAEVKDSDNDRVASRAYTVNSSNTWEHKTLTYNADTTGEFGNDNGASLRVQYLACCWFAVSPVVLLAMELLSLQTDGNRLHSSQVNLGDTVGNEWYITGIQLEVGEQATPFEHRSYSDEWEKCKRYYQEMGEITGMVHNSYTASNSYAFVQYEKEMRTSPTVTIASTGMRHFFKLVLLKV